MSGCICEGNWRAIVKETQPDIGKRFRDEKGDLWTLFGVVHGDDDYYYGMCREGRVLLLSCVGSVATHGFELAEDIRPGTVSANARGRGKSDESPDWLGSPV